MAQLALWKINLQYINKQLFYQLKMFEKSAL